LVTNQESNAYRRRALVYGMTSKYDNHYLVARKSPMTHS
jgi:hypothetical protein